MYALKASRYFSLYLKVFEGFETFHFLHSIYLTGALDPLGEKKIFVQRIPAVTLTVFIDFHAC